MKDSNAPLRAHLSMFTAEAIWGFMAPIAKDAMNAADAVIVAVGAHNLNLPIPGADGRSLARTVRLMGHTDLIFVDRAADMDDAIMMMARDGDVVVTMGAGNVGLVAPRLKAANQ